MRTAGKRPMPLVFSASRVYCTRSPGAASLGRSGLSQEQARAARIEGHVDRHAGRGEHREIAPEGPVVEIEGRARQRLERSDRSARGKDETRGWRHLEAIAARRHERESEHTGGKTVERAARIGHGLARDDFCRVAAHAIIAVHRGRCTARCVDEPHARAIERLPRARIEHDAERIDEGCVARRIERIARIRIACIERPVARDLEHTVPARAGTRSGRHVARKFTRRGPRLYEPQNLGIAVRRRHAHFDVLRQGGVAVLIGVPHAQEHCIASVHDLGIRERHGFERIDQTAALHERRRQRCEALRAAALDRTTERRGRAGRRSVALETQLGGRGRGLHDERHGI